jgi:YVTN family beta-propeller protein
VIEINQVVAYPVAITPDGRTAYVTNRNSDSVTPIDTATNTAGPAITVGSARAGSRSPRISRG